MVKISTSVPADGAMVKISTSVPADRENAVVPGALRAALVAQAEGGDVSRGAGELGDGDAVEELQAGVEGGDELGGRALDGDAAEGVSGPCGRLGVGGGVEVAEDGEPGAVLVHAPCAGVAEVEGVGVAVGTLHADPVGGAGLLDDALVAGELRCAVEV